MMDALKRMKPTCIEDIVALVALYRPGPMENIPVYCEVKNGQRALESIHPTIDHILAETQGIIVYQEQVMQIAQVMAGYSLGGADLLRRAMGKKIPEEMAKERPKFEKGAVENGVPAEKAREVFDLLEKFANYGFNKSHAAAYAVVSYQTAWLKANHPVEFMAGVMNCDIHLTDKLAVYFQEVKKGLGIGVVAPCVNRSEATFDVAGGRLVYALGALKNVGVDAMRIITEGRAGRPFVNLFDFARRVDLKRIGKRPLEMLARAGAFDVLDSNRRRVLESLDALVAWSQAVHEQKSSSQVSLFGEAGMTCPSRACRRCPIGPRRSGWPRIQGGGVLSVGASAGRLSAGAATQAGADAGRGDGAGSGGGFCRADGGDRGDPARAQVGAGEPVCLCHAVGPDGAVRGDGLLGCAGSGTGASGARDAGRAAGRGDDGGGSAEAARAVGDADRCGGGGCGATGLRVFFDDLAAVEAVASVLEKAARDGIKGGRGPVWFVPMAQDIAGEVEIDCGREFPVTPQIKGALRSLPGVVEVVEV